MFFTDVSSFGPTARQINCTGVSITTERERETIKNGTGGEVQSLKLCAVAKTRRAVWPSIKSSASCRVLFVTVYRMARKDIFGWMDSWMNGWMDR